MENTSDSFMPGPFLFCMKIERSVCYKVTDNSVGKFNREEEKKEQQEKSEARSSLKERLAAKQKEATQGNNKDTKELEKSKNSYREM